MPFFTNGMTNFDWKKYAVVFGITVIIFGTALYISNFANQKRLQEIQSIEDKIAIDILSSETQFSLLAESSCADVNNLVLSEELNSLSEKLSFTESNLGTDNTEVIKLKRYYSLLQIKDYLLMKKVREKCGLKPLVILYFYSNAGDCNECEKLGYVLTFLRNEYPELRVYSFDYNLELSALRTLKNILRIRNDLPVVVINDKPYYGFKEIEEFEKIMPELYALRLKAEKEKMATSTNATSTKKK